MTSPVVWSRSSFCSDSTCVEVAVIGESVMLRDAKNPSIQPIEFPLPEWHEFLDRVSEQAGSES